MPSSQKILFADGSQELVQSILSAPEAASYVIETAFDAPSCLEKLSRFKPDLLIIDLKLPKKHAIEILKIVKESSSIPVIIMAAQPLIQTYNWAIDFGADYFLGKPFEISFLFSLISRAFTGNLKPDSFAGKRSSSSPGESCYVPPSHLYSSYIKFWGTRGSCSVSGKEYLRYGGNTPCLEVRHDKDLVIIDAGTGIRPLGHELAASKRKEFHIFISHTHWDHIAGFTFFEPLYDKEATIHIWAPTGFRMSTEALFMQMITYPFFPVRMDDVAAKLVFHDLRDGDIQKIGSITISCAYAFHPGPTLCFKISLGDSQIGYITDNEVLMGYHGDPKEIGASHPLLDCHRPMLEHFSDCMLMIHEAQYTPLEYQRKVGWGHSSVTNAAAVIRHLNARDWIVTHHDPAHTDADILKQIQLHYEVMDHLGIKCRVRYAFDEFTVPL